MLDNFDEDGTCLLCGQVQSEHEEIMDDAGRMWLCPADPMELMKAIVQLADRGVLSDDWFLK